MTHLDHIEQAARLYWRRMHACRQAGAVISYAAARETLWVLLALRRGAVLP